MHAQIKFTESSYGLEHKLVDNELPSSASENTIVITHILMREYYF